MAIIETRDLTYTYGTGTPFEKMAVDHVNLSIEQGEFIGVIGHTGSGKSTLIQQLNGLLRPTSGTVLLDGKDIWAEPKKNSGSTLSGGDGVSVPGTPTFEETVLKDISFGPSNMGLEPAEIENERAMRRNLSD